MSLRPNNPPTACATRRDDHTADKFWTEDEAFYARRGSTAYASQANLGAKTALQIPT